MINNDIREITIRRCRNTLSIIGAGIILFGAWTVLKTFGLLLVKPEMIGDYIAYFTAITDAEELENALTGSAYIWMIVGMLGDLVMRLFVGVSAIGESRGRRGGVLYIVFAIMLMIGSIATVINGLISPDTVVGTNEDSVSGMIIELTSMLMILNMIIAAIRLRRLTADRRH